MSYDLISLTTWWEHVGHVQENPVQTSVNSEVTEPSDHGDQAMGIPGIMGEVVERKITAQATMPLIQSQHVSGFPRAQKSSQFKVSHSMKCMHVFFWNTWQQCSTYGIVVATVTVNNNEIEMW